MTNTARGGELSRITRRGGGGALLSSLQGQKATSA
eukprot:CAMPEP_0206591344 /NCGR_PEP_ID=MMETSP0325_2-20121206/40198_1 /ASSEMBLY_ACC=CAM_ASM_000347 /TAXON_ID=2866 /ORGANISM="Crypthecodinium cohnii, Strain Seligo" /LENGTH=34 /DNA_ID= /DNA_START= /DNA_END= /DNA_ORIENTATION=